MPDKSLISECEGIANEIFEKFIELIDEKTHNFDEYQFAYKLAFDTLRNNLERSAP